MVTNLLTKFGIVLVMTSLSMTTPKAWTYDVPSLNGRVGSEGHFQPIL
jgi:hypothetical protein